MKHHLRWRALLAAVFFVSSSSCGANLLPTPENRAAALPLTADVAVGATHDLLIVACRDRVTLSDFVFPVAATALFVGFGRLDAVFYLPDALVQAAIPECEPIAAQVSGAAFEGAAFELTPTENPFAFQALAREAGSATFRAEVEIEGELIEVESTLTAHQADRVEFAPRCDTNTGDLPMAAGYLPADEFLDFDLGLFAADIELQGYGYHGVTHPRLSFHPNGFRRMAVQVEGPRGSFTVTSADDPSFSLDLTVFDATDFDGLSLTRLTGENLFVGETTYVQPEASIGGEVPCIWGYQLRREVTIETPTVCRFEGRTDSPMITNRANGPMEIEALAPGTCQLTIAQPGTTLSASLAFEVHRGFEAQPIGHNAHPATNIEGLFIEGSGEMTLVGWEDDVSGMLESLTLRMTGGVWGGLRKSRNPQLLRAVHGAADGTLMAVGRDGLGTSWDGAAWVPFDTGQTEDLYDLWVSSATEIYAVGDAGTFLHFDGVVWRRIATGTTARLRSVWSDGTYLYLAGWEGWVKRWDGQALTDLLPVGLVDATFSPNDIRGSGPGDLWVVSARQALHYDGLTWGEVDLGIGAGDTIWKAWPMGDGTTYLLVHRGSASFVDRWDGSQLVSIPIPSGPTEISGTGNEVYVVGDTTFLRYAHDPADVFP